MNGAVAPSASRPRQRVVLGRVAWEPHAELDLAEWVEHGRRIGGAGRSCGWWIGDWLRYGNARFGERYTRAANATGYDVQTLMNMVYVAAHVDVSRRREMLSWSHHAELAALPVDAQEAWLSKAEEHNWSVRDMRTEIRNARSSPATGLDDAALDLPPLSGAPPSDSQDRTASESATGGEIGAHGEPDQLSSGARSRPGLIVCPDCGYEIHLES